MLSIRCSTEFAHHHTHKLTNALDFCQQHILNKLKIKIKIDLNASLIGLEKWGTRILSFSFQETLFEPIVETNIVVPF